MVSIPARAQSWLLIPPNGNTAGVQLYCFPYAGGGTWNYQPWPGMLGDEIAVYAVKLPGRAERLRETPATDMHTLADTLARHIGPTLRPPYAFFGYSMGALLAYECAQRLIRAGAPPPTRLITAAAPAPSQINIPHPLHTLADAELFEAVQAKYQNPMMASLDAEVVPLVLPALRADLTLYETYQPRPDTPPLPCPISAVGGLDDCIPDVSIQAWHHHTKAPFTAHWLPGGHFLIHEQTEALVGIVRAELDRQ